MSERELRKVVKAAIDLIAGESVGLEWKSGCADFLKQARAALSQPAPASEPTDPVDAQAIGRIDRHYAKASEPAEHPGCSYCNHPLFAAMRCECGKVFSTDDGEPAEPPPVDNAGHEGREQA